MTLRILKAKGHSEQGPCPEAWIKELLIFKKQKHYLCACEGCTHASLCRGQRRRHGSCQAWQQHLYPLTTEPSSLRPFFKRQNHTIAQAGLGPTEAPASASPVLELQVNATMSGLKRTILQFSVFKPSRELSDPQLAWSLILFM